MADLPPPVAADAEPPVDSLLGKVLNGRFTVLERVGSGGMGRVYRAMQAPLDRVCALKVLNPGYSTDQDPSFAKRFFLEASVTSKLTHPNTITIFDYGRTDEGVFFIAMEYLQGRTLHQTIAAEGALSAQRATHIARQICRALREAHALGIVHRDLKPANVMLLHHGDDEDFVKVLDFGLVKFFTDQPGRSPDEAELTQGGVFLGSPTYMAPEQARNHADPRSDVYSLGVVLYHLLAGRPPFQGRAPVDIILKHVNEPPPPFRAELHVPPDVEAVVQRALSKSPADRFQTMDEFLEALKRTGASSASDVMSMGGMDSRPVRVRAPSGSGAFPTSPPPLPASVEVGLGTESKAIQSVTEPGRAKSGPSIGVMIAVGLALCGVVAGGVVLFSGKSTPRLDVQVTPAPVPTPPAPVPTPSPTHPPPTPAPVVAKHLRVSSVPAGATVQMDGQVLGVTPLAFSLDPDQIPGPLQVTSSGFTSADVTASADAEGWSANVVLVKTPLAPTPPSRPTGKPGRPTSKKPTAAKPAGYKDDPYAD